MSKFFPARWIVALTTFPGRVFLCQFTYSSRVKSPLPVVDILGALADTLFPDYTIGFLRTLCGLLQVPPSYC